MIFGIGVDLVVAAAVVLTVVSCGAAASPAGIFGAIVLGAAKGALIGAAIGTAVGIAGGAIYAGVTGANMGDSILQGFLMGFGGGAIIGAVIGGAVGAATYSPGIQWTSSRLYAGQRMLERGIIQNMVQTVLRTGKYTAQTVDKFLVAGKITVVITSAGELITVWNNTGKLQAFLEFIKKIFGR
ncbi:MAG: hypothetical protein LBL18_05355 [Bacteroidales bacterium]|jgi:hypothetical protein|nr:hypothetical protein [Bacteroidales bacterium]